MSNPLNQLCALVNLQTAQLLLVSMSMEGFAVGSIVRLGETWTFPISHGAQVVASVNRKFDNDSYFVTQVSSEQTFGCSTPVQVFEAVKVIQDKVLLPRKVAEAHAQLERVTGQKVKIEVLPEEADSEPLDFAADFGDPVGGEDGHAW